jgi:hypothetical protein
VFLNVCRVISPVIIISLFLLVLSNSPAFLLEGPLRRPLACLCSWLDSQYSYSLLVQPVITLPATFAHVPRAGWDPVRGFEEPCVANRSDWLTPWLYSPCRTLASFTTVFQSSPLCARILRPCHSRRSDRFLPLLGSWTMLFFSGVRLLASGPTPDLEDQGVSLCLGSTLRPVQHGRPYQ